jgi:anti-sigma factor RsiW
MSKPIIQIGTEQREMTDAEFAQWQADNEAHAAEAAAVEAQAAARKSALSKIAALGLTEQEIAALIRS